MEEHQSKAKDIEKVLKEIGDKIEELVKKGADAGMDVKDEIEKKIQELKDNKTTLEAEFKKGRDLLERELRERKEDIEPKLKESRFFLMEGFKQFGLAIKALFDKK